MSNVLSWVAKPEALEMKRRKDGNKTVEELGEGAGKKKRLLNVMKIRLLHLSQDWNLSQESTAAYEGGP